MSEGRLRIYLGVAPGAGATYRMIDEGHRRSVRGTDVAVSCLDPRSYEEAGELLSGLDVVPPADGGGIDVGAVIDRNPQVLLVDDLHARNRPGAARRRRHEDISAILDAGIDVIVTTSAHHLSSLQDLEVQLAGRRDPDELPDEVVSAAAQVELVDMTPEAIRRRLAHGRVVPPDDVDATVAEFFRPEHLTLLRSRVLEWMADDASRRAHAMAPGVTARERVVVGLTGAPAGMAVVTAGLEFARRSDAEVIGVHVRPADGLASRAGPFLDAQRRAIKEASGSYHELVGDDVGVALASFVAAERAQHLFVGARRGRHGSAIADAALQSGSAPQVHVVASAAPGGHGALLLPRVKRRVTPIPRRRLVLAWLLCLIGLPLLTFLQAQLRTHFSLSTDVLISLSMVLAVAAVGGLVPGLVASVLGFGLINWYFVAPFHTLHIADVENVVTLVVFVAVAAVVSALVDRSANRSREARRARAEAAALASSSAALVGSSDPLPALLGQLRSVFALDAASVLARHRGGWSVSASVGTDPPARPSDGIARQLVADGSVVLVFRGDSLAADDQLVLSAFIDQLATAWEANRLRSDAERLEALGRTNALRSALLQAVSHDLRTPLASIKASVSGLLYADDVSFSDADRSSLLVNIDRSSDRLDRVVGNLLDMSRIQAGRIDPTTRPTALEEVVASALGDVDPESLVVADVPESLPLVEADAELLERSVANVISNALAWSPPGAVVRVEAARVAGRVDLRVVDRGPGIPADQRDAVFEPFQRFGDRSNDAGVGLGLAIARGFTLAMGGTLLLEDTPGGGLTATFGLPIAEGEQ